MAISRIDAVIVFILKPRSMTDSSVDKTGAERVVIYTFFVYPIVQTIFEKNVHVVIVKPAKDDAAACKLMTQAKCAQTYKDLNYFTLKI